MKTGWKFAIVGGLILGAQLTLTLFATAGSPGFPKSELVIDDGTGGRHKFHVEVALTDKQQQYGLMFRSKLAEDAGMIFIWPKPFPISMWMKNTAIPLDMVFLAPDGTVTHVAPDAKPQSLDVISSGPPAAAVIEINGGEAAKLHIVAGDKVESKDLEEVYPPTPSTP